MSTRRQIQAAQLPALAERLCAEPRDPRDNGLGAALHVQLDAGGGELVDKAVAALHAISTDPQVLNEGAARLTAPPATPMRCYALRLMVAAGADEAEARRIMAARSPRGQWDPGNWDS